MVLFIIGFLCVLIILILLGKRLQPNFIKKENRIQSEENNEKTENYEFENIKDHFQVLRNNWKADLKQIENAIQELCSIRDEKNKILFDQKNKSNEIKLNMEKHIQLYRQSKNDSLKEKYSKLSLENESIQNKIKEIEANLFEKNDIIKNYIEKKEQLKNNLENLKLQEKETILNVNSLKKIQEIETKLDSFGENEYNKSIERLKEYNSKVVSLAKANIQLNKNENKDFDEELLMSGREKKYNEEFNLNLKMEELWSENQNEKLPVKSNKNDLCSQKKDVEKLFS